MMRDIDFYKLQITNKTLVSGFDIWWSNTRSMWVTIRGYDDDDDDDYEAKQVGRVEA